MSNPLREAAELVREDAMVLRVPVDTNWKEARRYPKTNSGGCEVIVSVQRRPPPFTASFYRIESEGLPGPLVTGSGMHQLVHDIAEAVASGMLCKEG